MNLLGELELEDIYMIEVKPSYLGQPRIDPIELSMKYGRSRIQGFCETSGVAGSEALDSNRSSDQADECLERRWLSHESGAIE